MNTPANPPANSPGNSPANSPVDASMHQPLPFPPRVSYDTEPFWKYCAAHELRLQKCSACGAVRWPVALVCPQCLGRDFTWSLCGGQGRIYSFVVFHRAFHPRLEGLVPYVVASVQLEEGPRFTSNIVNCAPSSLECEQPVRLIWKDGPEGISLPVFEPVPK
ncbi:OB-fold domain-containing protein [Desulfovibrio sp. OttesenSCG-928-C14]|nr:OB-fold domain-containing protein [Desulfovibrio sp. OttesenSCG-928-C14]